MSVELAALTTPPLRSFAAAIKLCASRLSVAENSETGRNLVDRGSLHARSFRRWGQAQTLSSRVLSSLIGNELPMRPTQSLIFRSRLPTCNTFRERFCEKPGLPKNRQIGSNRRRSVGGPGYRGPIHPACAGCRYG